MTTPIVTPVQRTQLHRPAVTRRSPFVVLPTGHIVVMPPFGGQRIAGTTRTV